MVRPLAGFFFDYVRDCVRDHLIGLAGQFLAENVALRVIAFGYFCPFIHYLFPLCVVYFKNHGREYCKRQGKQAQAPEYICAIHGVRAVHGQA
jgi:hypothetical protein